MNVLKITTAGSVDDGKSTLIGRLLYDTKSIMDDQLSILNNASKIHNGKELNLALITDGLKSEREQGITIDVAYRYFTTKNRKFIIADTPGHTQFTRNMVTGASNADVSMILVDARNGIVEQTKRHLFICVLLGIKDFVICINKMDLVHYDLQRFAQIKKSIQELLKSFSDLNLMFIPISALTGENIVLRSEHVIWYSGNTLLAELEGITTKTNANPIGSRFAVQTVIRPQSIKYHDYRAYAGRLECDSLIKNQRVLILPEQIEATIESIEHSTKEIFEAEPQSSISIRLKENVNVSRGNLIVSLPNTLKKSKELSPLICWFSEETLSVNTKFIFKFGVLEVECVVSEILCIIDINNFEELVGRTTLNFNEIGKVKIRLAASIYHDLYKDNKGTSSFILIDKFTHETMAAGWII